MHRVKCYKCGEYFNADKVPFIKVSARRYAHQKCDNENPEMEDKVNLHIYIKKLFNIEQLSFKICKQLEEYTTKYGYSYSGILKTLQYWYDVKKNSIEKANGGLGIVPYIYEEAKGYYYNLFLVQEVNKNIDIKKRISYQINTINVPAPIPQRPAPPQFDF